MTPHDFCNNLDRTYQAFDHLRDLIDGAGHNSDAMAAIEGREPWTRSTEERMGYHVRTNQAQ